ncbi:MAG: helix-turn-helix domain-containing protein [Thermonemataceae bacterium]
MTFFLIDLLIIPAILQGFLIAAALVNIKQGSLQANRSLAALVVCCTLTLLGKLLYTRADTALLQLAMVLDTVIFLFCPFIYLFLRYLFFYDAVKNKFLHFIPAGVYLSIILYLLTVGRGHYAELAQTGSMGLFYYIEEGVGLLINLIYLFKSYRLYKNYARQVPAVVSFDQGLFQFLGIFLFITSLCMACWLVSFLSLGILGKQLPYVNYTTLWFFVPFLTYVVGYYMLSKPEIFRIRNSNAQEEVPSEEKEYTTPESTLPAPTKKPDKKRLKEEEVIVLKEKLLTAFEKNKVFLEEKITLYALAERLGTSANDLSWLLNTVYGKTFYDFVNEYRLKEFLSKVAQKEYKQKTILALALEAGFGTKSTFNKVFKSAMQTTPSAYIKSLEYI